MKRIVLALLHNRIQVGIGSPGVKAGVDSLYKLNCPGSIDGWENAARHLWETYSPPRKHVLMVLPDSAFKLRILTLPPMRSGCLARAARDALQYDEKYELVTDYIPLERKKIGVWRVLACSCRREDLQRYIDMTRRLELELEGITIPAAAALKLLRGARGMRDQSCIWLRFDGASLLSLLAERGVCLYAAQTSLESEPGAANFAASVVEAVSLTLQFRAERHMNAPLSLYYAGCEMGEFEDCVPGLRRLGVQPACLPRCERIVHFPDSKRMSGWLSCSGAMLRRRGEGGAVWRKGLDLYRRYRKSSRDGSKRSIVGSRWFPVVVTILLCTLAWQALAFRNRGLERKLSEYQLMLDDPQYAAVYEEVLEKTADLDQLEQRIISARTLTRRLASYPEIDAELLNRIAAVGGEKIRATVTGYDSGSGELLVKAESQTSIDTSGYVRDLERLDLFPNVAYSGYSLEDGLYTLQLTCALRADD